LLCQDTTTTPAESIPLQVSGGSLHAWRAAGDKVEGLEKSGKVAPADRLGTLNGEPARFSTEGALVVQLRGIKVSSGKGLALERKGGKLTLKLYKGTVVVESYESEIELETPFGKVAGKEVYFVATVDEKSTKVVALEGKVTLTNDLGSVTIGEGMSSEADAGKAPGAPRPSPPKDVEAVRAVEEGNLIRNPGFENRLEEWKIEYLPILDDTQVFHSGRRSMKVTVKDFPPNQPIFPPRFVKGTLKPGTRYLFRFYVRTENFTAAGKPADFKVVLDRSGRGSGADTQNHHLVPASDGTWSVHRFMVESTAQDFWFAMYCGDKPGPYTGTIWFDDFFLGEFPASPAKGK
jgi:hypothetical protein